MSNEGWQLRALRDRQAWKLGGTHFSKAVSWYTANIDTISKQCLPGEQAAVYSLSELILRMMGEGSRVWACTDESRWEDVVDASVSCDLMQDMEDGVEATNTASLGTVYSSTFLDLVMTIRRRSFTQGGMDAFLDLNQALQLCREFIAEYLHSTDAACMAEFAQLVIQMTAVPSAVSEEEEEEYGKSHNWSVLSVSEHEEYHVSPINHWRECDDGVVFEMVGLVLRYRQPPMPTDVELFVKGPNVRGKGPRRACIRSAGWWRREHDIARLMDSCAKCSAAGTGGDDWKCALLTALDRVARHPLETNGDVLCCNLHIDFADIVPREDVPDWPVVTLIPYSDRLKRAAMLALQSYLEERGAADGVSGEVGCFDGAVDNIPVNCRG